MDSSFSTFNNKVLEVESVIEENTSINSDAFNSLNYHISQFESSIESHVSNQFISSNSNISSVESKIGLSLDSHVLILNSNISSVEASINVNINSSIDSINSQISSFESDIIHNSSTNSVNVSSINANINSLEASLVSNISSQVSDLNLDINSLESNLSGDLSIGVSSLNSKIDDVEVNILNSMDSSFSTFNNKVLEVESVIEENTSINSDAFNSLNSHISSVESNIENSVSNQFISSNSNISSIESKIGLSLDSHVLSLNSNISSVESSINININSSIDSINSRISSVESEIIDNGGNTNTSSINNEISSLESSVSVNASDIVLLESSVSVNASDIVLLESSVSVNASDIIVLDNSLKKVSNNVTTNNIFKTQNSTSNITNLNLDGYGISINYDGTIVAVSDPTYSSNKGIVRIFQFENGSFVKLGGDIIGGTNNDAIGKTISLSGNGQVIAISNNDNTAVNPNNGLLAQTNTNNSLIYIYEYDTVNSTWNLTETINNTGYPNFILGLDLSLNYDGDILLLGNLNNYNTTGSGVSAIQQFKHNILIYQNIGGTWTEKINDSYFYIQNYENFNTRSLFVSLNKNGDRFIITDSLNNEQPSGYNEGDYSTRRSQVRVMNYNGTTITQVGSNLLSSTKGRVAFNVDINDDGDIVVFSQQNFNNNSGTINIYSLNGSIGIYMVIKLVFLLQIILK